MVRKQIIILIMLKFWQWKEKSSNLIINDQKASVLLQVLYKGTVQVTTGILKFPSFSSALLLIALNRKVS